MTIKSVLWFIIALGIIISFIVFLLYESPDDKLSFSNISTFDTNRFYAVYHMEDETDATSNYYNGILFNTTTVDCVIGQCQRFGLSKESIFILPKDMINGNGSQNYSITWLAKLNQLRPPSRHQDEELFILLGNEAHVEFEIEDSTLEIFSRDCNREEIPEAKTEKLLHNNTWYFFTVTYSEQTDFVQFYLNATPVLNMSVECSRAFYYNNSIKRNNSIGAREETRNRIQEQIKADIDEVWFWKETLNRKQI